MITGATGYIGQEFIKKYCNDFEIIGITSNKSNIKNVRCRYIECKMENIDKLPNLIKDGDIDLCLHFAWSGVSGDSRKDFTTQMNNVKYTLDLIDTLKKMGIKKFIGAGTLAEKDVNNYHLKNGSTPNETSTYGVCKLACNMLTKIKCNSVGIDHIWCQIGNVYGSLSGPNNFINYCTKNIISDEKSLFTDGLQIYDFVHIHDVINAIYCIIKNGKNNYCYYIGSGSPAPLKEYIIKIKSIVNPSKKLNFGALPYNGQSLKYEDYSIENLKKIGYAPKIQFENGISGMFKDINMQ